MDKEDVIDLDIDSYNGVLLSQKKKRMKFWHLQQHGWI